MAEDREQHTLFLGAQAAAISAIVVGVVVLGSQWAIGRVYSDVAARELMVAMTSPVSALASGLLSGLGAILALMLTLLSFSHRLSQGFSARFYRRIERIALLCILDMGAAIALLLTLSAPIQKAGEQAGEQAGGQQVVLTYYLLLGLTALVAGLFMAVIVMLYNAVQAIIRAVGPEQ